MILYHGTAASPAEIAKNGILPRGERATNWADHPSRSDCVYLTAAYGLYFAFAAGKGDEPVSVVEVDISGLEDNLLPDEDALAQAYSRGRELGDATEFYRERLTEWQKLWRWSLDSIGNCAHLGPISPDRITRIATVDIKKAGSIVYAAMDPTITIMNYKLCGGKYHELTTTLFDGPDREGITVNRIRQRRTVPFICTNRAKRTLFAFASDREEAVRIACEAKFVRKRANCTVEPAVADGNALRLANAGFVGMASGQRDIFGKQKMIYQ